MNNKYLAVLLAFCLLFPACTKKKPYTIPKYYDEGHPEKITYSGPEPRVCTVTLVDDSIEYEVNAAEGQVCVGFKDNIRHNDAVNILKQNNAKIIAQIPYLKYYLAEVTSGHEGKFVSRMREVPEVNFIYPNAVQEVCSASQYVLDNFYGSHGERVAFMAGGCSSSTSVSTDEVGYKDGTSINTDKVIEKVDGILTNLGKNDAVVINMSFGVPWKGDISKANARAYKKRYIDELKNLVKSFYIYDDKDFIIVKSSGNEGVKNIDVILKGLKKELSPEERRFFEKHFILVSAKDDYKQRDYPNDVSRYDNMVTKVDISDATAQNPHMQGTSFSSPRAACYIAEAANNNNIKVVDALKCARRATQKANGNILAYELLEEEIRLILDSIDFALNPLKVTLEGVLKMYLLDNMSGGDVIYYKDEYGRTYYTEVEENSNKPYSKVVSEYIDINNENQYLAFVVETAQAIDVTRYLTESDNDFLSEKAQSAFMIVPNFRYTSAEFAQKYANKRVRVSGLFYVPMAGWRNATDVVMDLRRIEVVNALEDKNKDTPGEGGNDFSHLDYSEYVELKYENDFVPGLIAYNNSDYELVIEGDYTAGGETKRFSRSIDPHSSTYVVIGGTFTSYHVYSAFRK